MIWNKYDTSPPTVRCKLLKVKLFASKYTYVTPGYILLLSGGEKWYKAKQRCHHCSVQKGRMSQPRTRDTSCRM